MGLFSRKDIEAAPVIDASQWQLHQTDEGAVVAPAGQPLRPRVAPGGPRTRYKLLGRNDPEHGFITPPAFLMITEHGELRIGDEVELTQQEYQTFSKNAVFVPVEAL